MLLETKRRCLEEKVDLPELIRCDVCRLPIQSESLKFIHAGAALHCWPETKVALTPKYISNDLILQ